MSFLMSARYAYLRKYCEIFFTNLWVDFFLIWKYQEYSALPPEIGHMKMFLIILVETIINYY